MGETPLSLLSEASRQRQAKGGAKAAAKSGPKVGSLPEETLGTLGKQVPVHGTSG